MSNAISLSECCEKIGDPCAILCLLQKAEIERAIKGTVIEHEIGDEKHKVSLMGVGSLTTLIRRYETLCEAKCTGRKRGGGCFVIGPSTCGRGRSRCC